jgi:hypothetical protein
MIGFTRSTSVIKILQTQKFSARHSRSHYTLINFLRDSLGFFMPHALCTSLALRYVTSDEDLYVYSPCTDLPSLLTDDLSSSLARTGLLTWYSNEELYGILEAVAAELSLADVTIRYQAFGRSTRGFNVASVDANNSTRTTTRATCTWRRNRLLIALIGTQHTLKAVSVVNA